MEIDKKNKIDEIVADLLADYKDDKIINQEAFFSQPDKTQKDSTKIPAAA